MLDGLLGNRGGSPEVFKPACVVGAISDDKEIDDPGGKVEGHLCFTVDHGDAVSVPVAGPRHATTEQQERRPTQTSSSSVQFAHWLMCNISSGGGSTFAQIH